MAPHSKNNFAHNKTVGTQGAPAGHILEDSEPCSSSQADYASPPGAVLPLLFTLASFLLISHISHVLVNWTHWEFFEHLRHFPASGLQPCSVLSLEGILYPQALYRLHLIFLPFRTKLKQWFLEGLLWLPPTPSDILPRGHVPEQSFVQSLWFSCPYLCGPWASRGESLCV